MYAGRRAPHEGTRTSDAGSGRGGRDRHL